MVDPGKGRKESQGLIRHFEGVGLDDSVEGLVVAGCDAVAQVVKLSSLRLGQTFRRTKSNCKISLDRNCKIWVQYGNRVSAL